MDYQSALAFFGGTQAALAKVLGISQPVVSEWKGVIPPSYQFQIQVLSDGKLVVDKKHLARKLIARTEERAA